MLFRCRKSGALRRPTLCSPACTAGWVSPLSDLVPPAPGGTAAASLCGSQPGERGQGAPWAPPSTPGPRGAPRPDVSLGQSTLLTCPRVSPCRPHVVSDGKWDGAEAPPPDERLVSTLLSALHDAESRGASRPFAGSSGNARGELAARALLRVHTGDLLTRGAAAGQRCTWVGAVRCVCVRVL